MLFHCQSKKNVNIDKIKISEEFKKYPPKLEKLVIKTAEYINTGIVEPILLDEAYNLVDGYCSYLIIKALGIDKFKCVMIKTKKGR